MDYSKPYFIFITFFIRTLLIRGFLIWSFIINTFIIRIFLIKTLLVAPPFLNDPKILVPLDPRTCRGWFRASSRPSGHHHQMPRRRARTPRHWTWAGSISCCSAPDTGSPRSSPIVDTPSDGFWPKANYDFVSAACKNFLPSLFYAYGYWAQRVYEQDLA